MTKNKSRNGIGSRRRILVLALLAAFGPAHAEDDNAAALMNPNTAEVSAGVGWVSGNSSDRAFFGQYNGLRVNDFNLLLDYRYINRDENGLWTKSVGRNLGLDVLDIGFGQDKQGDWMYALGYTQFDWRDPRTINTGLQGVGSTSPMIGNALAAPGTGSNYDLSLKRKDVNVAVSKLITPNLIFDASYKFDDKEGSRLFGIGGYCSNTISPVCSGASSYVGALYLTPEPINSTTQQLEAKLTYSGETFSLTAGYYGGFYNNSNGVMTPGFPNGASTLTNTGDMLGPLAANLSQPVALPPDNQSSQFYVSGNTSLPLNTRINYKAAYTHATQNSDYPSQLTVGATPGLASLSGVLDTTLLQAGLTSRPLPKLTITGNLRWEDRQDKTDRGIYVVAPNGTQYTNNPSNSEFGNAKLEAGYQVTDVDRATLGVDYAYIERDVRSARRGSRTPPWRPCARATTKPASTPSGGVPCPRRSTGRSLSLRQARRLSLVRARPGRLASRSSGTTRSQLERHLPDDDGGPHPPDREADGRLVTHRAFSLNFSIEDGRDSYNGPNRRGPGRHQGPVLQHRRAVAVVGQLEVDRLRELRQAEPQHAAGHRLHRRPRAAQRRRGARCRRHAQRRRASGRRGELPGGQEQLQPGHDHRCARIEPPGQLLSRHHPEALGEDGDRQEVRRPGRFDPAVGELQRLDVGIQRRAVHVLGQLDGNNSADAERDVPRRALHLQVQVIGYKHG